MNREERKENFIYYYNKYKDKIYTYFCYRLNFNKKVAEDLTSEVFLKALKNFDRFDAARSFQSWIFAISRNHLINYYKICQREVSLENAKEKKTFLNIEEKIEIDRIMAAIKNMDEASREVLLLKFVDGLNNQEIAEVLSKEEGAVRTQISRSLMKLRSILN